MMKLHGRCPLKVKQEAFVIGYWLQLMTVAANNPLEILYDYLYRLSSEGYTNWCTRVGKID